MSSTVVLTHNAEIAHRIIGMGKCENVHGHGLLITWTFGVPDLEGDVAEFGSIKTRLRAWVDTHLDHAFLCHIDDPVGEYLIDYGLRVTRLHTRPTTEAIAALLAEKALELIPEVELLGVHVQESRSNAAGWAP
jgi:6-pyruvoyltetrahydropterin/6-carboxytetrahydropterin synthase